MTPSYEYIAGFIDADGHVGIVKSRPAKSAPQYYVRLTLYSQNLAVLNAISEVIGGYIQAFNNQKSKVGFGCYRLMVKPSEAVPALEKIGQAHHEHAEAEAGEDLVEEKVVQWPAQEVAVAVDRFFV